MLMHVRQIKDNPAIMDAMMINVYDFFFAIFPHSSIFMVDFVFVAPFS
jgi:hypothetical protein